MGDIPSAQYCTSPSSPHSHQSLPGGKNSCRFLNGRGTHGAKMTADALSFVAPDLDYVVDDTSSDVACAGAEGEELETDVSCKVVSI